MIQRLKGDMNFPELDKASSSSFDGMLPGSTQDLDDDDVAYASEGRRRSQINPSTAVKSRQSAALTGPSDSLEMRGRLESLDSDLDLEGDDDASDLDSEEELELMTLATGGTQINKNTSKGNAGSDDDF